MADAQVAEATSRARLAVINRDRDRDRGLYEQQVISKQALDSSTGEAERAEATLAAARANAEAVKQDIGQAPYLIPLLDATDNVALLPMPAGVKNSAARATAPAC